MKPIILFFTTLFVALTCAYTPLRAQKIPVNPKAGAVSIEEVSMTDYPADTTAAALILYEENRINLTPNANLEITKRVSFRKRIKILKETGKEYADFKIYYSRDANDGEYVADIRVTTYNLDNGAIKKTKLDKQYIFRENITDKTAVCSFSAPEVRVGSVIEVSYEMKSDRYWDIPLVELQYDIPANRIEARLEYTNFFSFNKLVHGFLTPRYEQEISNRHLGISGGQSLDYTLVMDIYHAIDVPAMQTEGHSYCPDQYLSAVEYQLSAYVVPGYLNRSFSQQWSDVDKALIGSPVVKECHVRNSRLSEIKEQAAAIEDEVEQIAFVRKLVTDIVKWDGKKGFVPVAVGKTLKNGTGSSASINAIVASVLNEMGYKADPVMIKLRSEGLLADFHVSSDAFSTFILRIVTPSGAIHFLDAARSDAYVDVLDPNYLVDRGRLITESGIACGWLDVRSLVKNTEMVNVSALVSENGEVSGAVHVSGKNESAYEMKRDYHSAESEEVFIAEMEEEGNCEISGFEFSGNEYSPAATYRFNFTQEATVSGDYLYIRPFLFPFHSETSFINPTRVIPIDFPFAESILYNYILEIPEGFVIEQLPQSTHMTAAGIQAEVRCQFGRSDDHHIQVRYNYKNNTMLAPAESYADIRVFWEQLSNLYKTTIVLKKV